MISSNGQSMSMNSNYGPCFAPTILSHMISLHTRPLLSCSYQHETNTCQIYRQGSFIQGKPRLQSHIFFKIFQKPLLWWTLEIFDKYFSHRFVWNPEDPTLWRISKDHKPTSRALLRLHLKQRQNWALRKRTPLKYTKRTKINKESNIFAARYTRRIYRVHV